MSTYLQIIVILSLIYSIIQLTKVSNSQKRLPISSEMIPLDYCNSLVIIPVPDSCCTESEESHSHSSSVLVSLRTWQSSHNTTITVVRTNLTMLYNTVLAKGHYIWEGNYGPRRKFRHLTTSYTDC